MFFMPNPINGSIGGTSLTLSIFLALILIPNSFLIKIIRVRVEKPIPIELIDGAFGSNLTLQSMLRSNLSQNQRSVDNYSNREKLEQFYYWQYQSLFIL